ncbi:hypothetical protein BSLG_004033 [Batrachochytrium salamandrivorans]|nr:hypothetical protein BSLG_004033 [Batrachochytrium salamandrivorans]
MYSPMTPMAGEMPNNGSGIYAPSPQTATAISRFDTSSPQPGSQTLNRIEPQPHLAQQDMLPMPVSNDQVGYGGHMAPLMYDMGDAVPS